MEIEVKSWLYDILNAIVEIESFFNDTPREFEKFQKDLKTKRAIERNIEIIGEAMNKLLQLDEKINISNARRMVDLRNRVIHGYDKVDDGVIWGILKRHLPRLKKEVEALLPC